MSKLYANERRMEIMRILELRRTVTMQSLADDFRVARQTIYNDILILTRSYPIETVQGRNGHVKLEDGYVLGKHILTEKVQQILLRIIPTLDKVDAKEIMSLLLVHGSKQNRELLCQLL